MDQVRLPDLEVIKRFSIAVRREHASVEEVLEALRADLAAIGGAQARPRREAPREPERRTTRSAAKPKPSQRAARRR